MGLTVRNRARANVGAGAAYTLPFTPLASSALWAVMACRQGVTYPGGAAPAGWTARILGSGSGDAYQVITAPGTVTTIPATGQVGDPNRDYYVLEIAGADHATAQGAQGAVVAAGSVPSAVVPASFPGRAGMAIAFADGLQGDFPSSTWQDLAGWTKEAADTFGGAAVHPWWAVYTQAFDPMPGTVQATFSQTWGGFNCCVAMTTIEAPAGGSGFAGEPGGGVW